MLDVLIFGALGGIIGARLYYVFSKWEMYAAQPEKIFAIWEGGLAIYGGLIGGIIAGLIVCKVEKLNVLNLLDLCGMSFLIGQGIGRWGNFANQEAFGTNTTLPWGMYSVKTEAYLRSLDYEALGLDPSDPVHPTFLYESLWCLLSFVILFIICKKFRKFSGQLFLGYGILYGLERFVVEGMRTDSLYIGNTNLRTSQVLSLAIFLVSLVLYIIFTVKYTKHPKPIEGVDFFPEIPLYRHRKKAAELQKTVDKLTEELTVLKAKREADEVEGKPDKNKVASVEKKLQKAQDELAAEQAKVKAQDEKKALKEKKKSKA